MPTVDPRWGKVGKQKIVDEGPLPPHPTKGIKYNMETVDDTILKFTTDFMEKAQKDGKPFFVWLNPTRMHVFTYLSPKYEALRTPENGWSIQEAGMAQFDDIIGSVDEEARGHGRGRQHDHRRHHGQRHGDLHLARRRHHAVQGLRRAWGPKAVSACRP